MRDFTRDHSALALNTATLGHNLDGAGAGWSPERVIDACAERGYGGFITVEQERDPRNAGGSLADVKASRDYLKSVGFVHASTETAA